MSEEVWVFLHCNQIKFYMKHLVEAYDAISKEEQEYIEVNKEDNSVRFTIQDGPIKEVGVNGIQAVNMLHYNLELFKSLNKAFPCRENDLTITKMEEAIHWQLARTADRVKRGVEGEYKA